MEVVDACSAVLSNREVLDLLIKNGKLIAGGHKKKQQTNLATILYETTSYLESSPISQTNLSNIAEFLNLLKSQQPAFELSRAEKIQIVNLLPQNATELHLIIDNIEERFTEEQRNYLLELVQTTLKKKPTSSGGSNCNTTTENHLVEDSDDISRKRIKQELNA